MHFFMYLRMCTHFKECLEMLMKKATIVPSQNKMFSASPSPHPTPNTFERVRNSHSPASPPKQESM